MAINKAMRAALKIITALEVDVEKSYKLERQIELLTAGLRGKPADYQMWDQKIVCGDHDVPVRIFRPPGTGPTPVLLFFHGGGWVTGGIEQYTRVCARLAKATGHTLASVDYRLAPEYRFPAAPEDCYAVAREFFLGHVLNVRQENITLIGDSAGGNLAAAVSLMARDRGEFLPRRQILLYPAVFNDHSDTSPFPSVKENGTEYLLTSKRIQGFMELYISSEDDYYNPYFAPLLAGDLSRQPRTLIISAEYCPLRDEGEYYGKKLRDAGNDVEIYRMKDALHAFLMLPPRFIHVKRAYQVINRFLAGRDVCHEKHQKME
ncbi:MAG TPA: alpha/beta hydrolase [Anaerovoracaceae bacterium]|nr:alpha/beta hydrolase [Anaerovoracaceae bacterium]